MCCRITYLSTIFFITSLSMAHAADLFVAKDPMPFINTNDMTWSGFYIGVQTGWLHNKVEHGRQNEIYLSYDKNPNEISMYFEKPDQQYNFTDNTFSGGLYMGYNFQLNESLLLGLEGDIAWFNSNESKTELEDPFFVSTNPKQNYNYVRNYDFIEEQLKVKRSAALRARLGYTNDRYLVYAAAGLATMRLSYNYTMDGFMTYYPASETIQKSLTGYTVGGGVEYALTNHVILRSEYRYTDYGSKDFDFSNEFIDEPVTLKADYKTHEVRLGIAYKFH